MGPEKLRKMQIPNFIIVFGKRYESNEDIKNNHHMNPFHFKFYLFVQHMFLFFWFMLSSKQYSGCRFKETEVAPLKSTVQGGN